MYFSVLILRHTLNIELFVSSCELQEFANSHWQFSPILLLKFSLSLSNDAQFGNFEITVQQHKGTGFYSVGVFSVLL